MITCVYFTDVLNQEFNHLNENVISKLPFFFAHLFKFQILEKQLLKYYYFSVVHFHFEKTEQNIKLLDMIH